MDRLLLLPLPGLVDAFREGITPQWFGALTQRRQCQDFDSILENEKQRTRKWVALDRFK
jgi:hypothetical protein